MIKNIAIIGGGPAGLFAAQTAISQGASVTLYEAKPSIGRKFLVAGKGGLNLTHGENISGFPRHYIGQETPPYFWENLLKEFDNVMIRRWAENLGITTFQATSGRVYPREMKAAPLLRSWREKLRAEGVHFAMNHRLIKIKHGSPIELTFSHSKGELATQSHAVILALGGGSWPITGSDGNWVDMFSEQKITTHPLTSANCGWEITWPESISQHAGKPIKNISASAMRDRCTGELMITDYGLEGGIIYQLGSTLRGMPNPQITIDFKPHHSIESLVKKMESVKSNPLSEIQARWKLTDQIMSLVEYFSKSKLSPTIHELAYLIKNMMIPLLGTRPIAEAISSAGGVCWSEIDNNLMLKKLPNVYVAGEMINWEAPTGGYLMQGCFATGHRAALSVTKK
jgi:uncharacterized flavoprotein (TIGR03862 family)